ncbi:methyltransferase [Actinokineospora diospyrosa]|uniref:Release factor glutamine methyltransferase n=1 Tax=Actinokineospora diospyrosa TaxID=103728 RepID=A0ABT1I5H4_9PSEU|nr:methyltransferase [Actinokineospora diospyrosa]MCP2267878.1 release factor glutamine methyltransferase [Actinokineospora diospyrosa]
MVLNDPKSGTTEAYRPLMSDERVEQLRGLHAMLTDSSGGPTEVETREFLGLTLQVPPQVMTPCPVSHLFGQAILAEVKEGDRVLEMGTGSGAHGILAAGKAASVLAVDINPHAVLTARANAASNGVADLVETRQSDVFTAVDGQYDLIIFNPPFQWFPARDVVESATTDENYGALTRFFREAKQYLATDGRMMIFFSTAGDVEYLRRLIEAEGYEREVVFKHTGDFAGMPADFFTFRVTLK